jgi:outer membrane receptor protein involved in Fe transport
LPEKYGQEKAASIQQSARILMSKSTSNSEYRIAKKALALAVTAALATQVQAQQDANEEVDSLLEEVIVTASKREASVQDLAMSVTALNMAALEKAEITDISRLDTMVPGLQFASSGNEVRLALRGTRQNNVGTEGEQAVGIFEDGVYVPTSTQAMGSYLDINRIEVLRGPQGTLYGRNTFGGTINIITNDPQTEEFYGNVMALYGDYNRVKLEGVVNIPLSESFALRLAALSDNHDGYIINTWIPGTSDDLNDRDDTVVRVGAKWFATENFTAKLKITYNDRESNGSAIWGYQQIGGYRDGEYFPGHQYAPANATENSDEGPWRIARNQKSNADIENSVYTLNLDWDFPDFATLKFIGNVTEMDGTQNYDPDYSDGGDAENAGFTGWISTQDTWSAELQLVSNTDGRVDWMAGLYFYDQTATWNWMDLEDGVFSVPHWDNQGDYLSDSFGAFANATFSVSDRTRLIGGLRYAEDSKKQRDLLDWNVWPPEAIPNSGLEGEWDKWLWKAGIEFDLNDDMLTYFTASTGYRAGGINVAVEGVPLTYDPEEVLAYELGLKSVLLNGGMTLNLAAYYNDFSDMQAQSFRAQEVGVLEFTENGGAVDVMGIEVEMNWVPGGDSNWNVGAQLSLMDAEFGEYTIGKIFGVGDLDGRQDLDNPDEPLLNLRGMSPAMSPEFTLGSQVSYNWMLDNKGMITPYVQVYYTDDYYGFDLNMPGNRQDSYARWDFRLMWDSPSGAFHVNAFVLNATDEEVFNRALIFNPSSDPLLGSIQTNWANPRTWGVAMRYNF